MTALGRLSPVEPAATGGEHLLCAAGVTVAVLNYNGRQVLGTCLESLRGLTTPVGEILLVDDGSSDGSPDWVRENFPDVRIVEMGENTKRLNVVRNRAIREASKDLVLLVDNDMVLAPACLEWLLWGMRTLPGAAICTPRTLFDHDPTLIYQDAQVLHYVGATPAGSRNLRIDEAEHRPRLSIGLGGLHLLDRGKALQVDLFNEEYVMGWGDDGEFDHRMNLAGHLCYSIPAALVYHRRVAGARRYYGTVRNRWRFILECYHLRTLVLCAPALLLYEFAIAGFLISKGAGREYLRAAEYMVRHLPSVLRVRRRVQARRRVSDGRLMGSGELFVSSEYVDSSALQRGLRLLNAALDGYWRLVRRFL